MTVFPAIFHLRWLRIGACLGCYVDAIRQLQSSHLKRAARPRYQIYAVLPRQARREKKAGCAIVQQRSSRTPHLDIHPRRIPRERSRLGVVHSVLLTAQSGGRCLWRIRDDLGGHTPARATSPRSPRPAANAGRRYAPAQARPWSRGKAGLSCPVCTGQWNIIHIAGGSEAYILPSEILPSTNSTASYQ